MSGFLLLGACLLAAGCSPPPGHASEQVVFAEATGFGQGGRNTTADIVDVGVHGLHNLTGRSVRVRRVSLMSVPAAVRLLGVTAHPSQAVGVLDGDLAPSRARWRDPRARLLTGEAWERARETGMNALSLPTEPTALLADHATTLDTACREVAARLGGDGPASVDEVGKLHLAALKAVPDPPSLVDLRRICGAGVEAMLPEIDLPELVLEVMSWVPGFTEAFTHASG